MSKKPKIAIDIDDTLSSFIAEFLKWYNIKLGTSYDFNDFKDYYWPNWMDVTEKEAVKSVHDFFETEEFKNLPVLDGAKEWVEQMSEKYELYIVTARQTIVERITRDWLDKNFADKFKEVVFGNHYALNGVRGPGKGELCEKLGCEVLIDDNFYHLESLEKHGIKAVLLDRPWNKEIKDSEYVKRAYNWDEASKYLEEYLMVVK